MSTASVEEILHEIESLSEEQRLALDQQLAGQLHEHWEQEAGIARKEAQRRGIDQATIDRTIDRHRYER